MRSGRSTPYIRDGHATLYRKSLVYKPPTIGLMTILYMGIMMTWASPENMDPTNDGFQVRNLLEQDSRFK